MNALQRFVESQEILKQEINPLFHWISLLSEKRPDVYRHSIRVAMLAERLALKMKLDISDKETLLRGCFLHDLGKLMIPLDILEQSAPLSDKQWSLIKLHPQLGFDLVQSLFECDSGVSKVILHHHERWDGQGYPHGLEGEAIPLLARICAVADATDAMLSRRPFRQPLPLDKVQQELARNRKLQFDPDIVRLMLELLASETSDFSYFQER